MHGDDPEPWDPSIYDQSIPSSGYSYLTTRDGTKLALTVHPPTTDTTHVLMNNCYRDYAQQNARELAELLR